MQPKSLIQWSLAILMSLIPLYLLAEPEYTTELSATSSINQLMDRVTTIPIKNDIQELLKLKDEEPLIKALEPFINTCKIYAIYIDNNPANESRPLETEKTYNVLIVNKKCTITIVARLDYFAPLDKEFDKFLYRAIGRFCKGHIMFCFTIDPDDLYYVQHTDGAYLRISNIIIDYLANMDNYIKRSEFSPSQRRLDITIIDKSANK